ncbi:MAG: hypothetical protein U0T81_03055 [Saprospiraceae bacterium]
MVKKECLRINLMFLLISAQIFAQTSPLVLVSAQSEFDYKGRVGKKSILVHVAAGLKW